MQVEKINSQTARIILTIDELAEHQITLKDIKAGKEKARDFFYKMLENSKLLEYFEADSNQLLIEATSKDNLFTITITKADCIPDIKCFTNTSSSFTYTVSSNIYVFDTLSNLYDFCTKAYKENLFVGINSLYKLGDHFFLMFNTKTIKDARFIKTFSVLSEYATYIYANSLYKNYLQEHSVLLIAKTATYSIFNI